VFHALDHGAIFLLIAGTYTPFTLGILRGGWGWMLLGSIWGLALAGLIFRTIVGFRYPMVSTVIYVAMGWLVLIAIHPLWQRMPHEGFLWILAGTTCHFLAVIWYST
jgi:hemolysin III